MEKVTREYEVFTFDELSDGAKKKALEQLRDINTDYEWFDCILEDEKIALAKLGYNDADIKFSGFSSQGDGASFTCSVDVLKVIAGMEKDAQANFRPIVKLLKSTREPQADITMSIKTSGIYSHEYSMSIDEYHTNELDIPPYDVLMDELSESILAYARREAKRIYKELASTYDELTSENAIIETINANEYRFLQNGKMFTE